MRTSRIAGVLIVVAGLAINTWTLEAFVVADGAIETTHVLGVIAAVELALVAAGVWLYVAAPRWRRLSARDAALLSVSTALSIGLGEAALRLQPNASDDDAAAMAREQRPPSNFEASDIGWRMIPNREFRMSVEQSTNSYASNAQGFRSPHDYTSTPAPFIALAGDSFTWGWGVEYRQTFGARLEQHLDGPQVENFGMPGFGLDQVWQTVRTEILPRKPALVIVGFIDDDFGRSLDAVRAEEGFPKPRFVVDAGRLRPQAPGETDSWLRRHSALSRLAGDALLRVRPFGEWWVLNTALIDAIADDCARQSVPVLFVRLPQIDGNAFPSLARRFQQRGLAYLDLGPSAPDRDLHYKEDHHLNARGHELVAAALEDWIAAHQRGLR